MAQWTRSSCCCFCSIKAGMQTGKGTQLWSSGLKTQQTVNRAVNKTEPSVSWTRVTRASARRHKTETQRDEWTRTWTQPKCRNYKTWPSPRAGVVCCRSATDDMSMFNSNWRPSLLQSRRSEEVDSTSSGPRLTDTRHKGPRALVFRRGYWIFFSVFFVG